MTDGNDVAKWQDRLGAFIERALGPVAEDAIGYLGRDRLRIARIEKAVGLVNKAERRLEEKGVAGTRPMLLKHLLPILEEASIEDDDDIHSLWARLLAEALDPGGVPVDKIYIGVLKELRPKDAKVLAYMWKYRTISRGFSESGKHLGDVDLGHLVPFKRDHLLNRACADDRTIRQLHRVALTRPIAEEREVVKPDASTRSGAFEIERQDFYGDLDIVGFTELGLEFCKALIKEGV